MAAAGWQQSILYEYTKTAAASQSFRLVMSLIGTCKVDSQAAVEWVCLRRVRREVRLACFLNASTLFKSNIHS
jgi:hypothetical protein